MKRLITLLIFVPTLAWAEQPPMPNDPRIEMYRQLLGEANDRLVGMTAQTQQLQTQSAAQVKAAQEAAAKSAASLVDMTKERDAAKAETTKAQVAVADLIKQLADTKVPPP